MVQLVHIETAVANRTAPRPLLADLPMKIAAKGGHPLAVALTNCFAHSRFWRRDKGGCHDGQ
jgi:hypothetical protein